MAETTVIREFLVALGYKQDEAALKRFSDGIEKATKSVFALAAAVETTAIAVAAGVARFASNLEALYFASQRTGASVNNIKALGVAAANFGSSADDALSSVEGLAKFLRNNPGGEAFLGVPTRDARGQLRDMTDILIDLGKHWASMPQYLTSQYAGMFGISDRMMLALRNGDFAREVARVRTELKDSGFGQASLDAHRFMMGLRDLELYLLQFAARVEDALQNRLGLSVRSATEYLRDHGKELAEKLVDVLQKLWNVVELLKPAFVWLYDKFVAMDKATDGWSTKLILAGVALKYMGGAEIIGGVLSLAAAFLKLGTGVTAATTGGGLIALLGRLGIAAGGGIGLGLLIDKLFPSVADFGEKIGGMVYQAGNRVPDALRFFQDRGWSAAQAAGIVSNLISESGLGAGATGDNGQAYGVAQWHPDRQADFAHWAGHGIRGSSREEQYAFIDYELRMGSRRAAGALLHAARTADQAGQVVSRDYESPAAGAAAAAERGRLAARLFQQTTTINVNGAGDPVAVAHLAAGEQTRVNAELARNFSNPLE